MFDADVLPDEHPTKGWNRASIIFWSRRPYRPRLTAKDRQLPRGAGPDMLLTSAAAGMLLSLSLGWFVLFVVNLYRPLSGPLYGEVLGGLAVALTALLYGIAAFRGRRL